MISIVFSSLIIHEFFNVLYFLKVSASERKYFPAAKQPSMYHTQV